LHFLVLKSLISAQSSFEQRVKQARLDAERLIQVQPRVGMQIIKKSDANKFRNRKLAFLFIG
jgi:hypothetical protein